MPKVKVDYNKCNGDEICVYVCPAEVFEMQKLDDYPDSLKSIPVNPDACILCMACTSSCPTNAITIEE
jgi:NAD-dependent dihydropyrimidine dehydrogenase PreA subunit